MQLNQICACSNINTEKKSEYKHHYDIEYPSHHYEKEEVIAVPADETLTKVKKSSEEWKFVERLLPNQWIPEPPIHDQYPTPSGWIPANGKLNQYLTSVCLCGLQESICDVTCQNQAIFAEMSYCVMML